MQECAVPGAYKDGKFTKVYRVVFPKPLRKNCRTGSPSFRFRGSQRRIFRDPITRRTNVPGAVDNDGSDTIVLQQYAAWKALLFEPGQVLRSRSSVEKVNARARNFR